MTPEAWSQAMVMEPKKRSMQKSPDRISNHSVSCPAFIHWKPHTSKEVKGEKGTEINHKH